MRSLSRARVLSALSARPRLQNAIPLTRCNVTPVAGQRDALWKKQGEMGDMPFDVHRRVGQVCTQSCSRPRSVCVVCSHVFAERDCADALQGPVRASPHQEMEQELLSGAGDGSRCVAQPPFCAKLTPHAPLFPFLGVSGPPIALRERRFVLFSCRCVCCPVMFLHLSKQACVRVCAASSLAGALRGSI